MVKKARATPEPAVEPTEPEPEPKSLASVMSKRTADVCSAASNALPFAGAAWRKSVYTGFYYLTYGVVFGSLALASLLPSDTAMSKGIHDGAEAARKDFANRRVAVEAGAEEAAATA